MCSRIFTHCSYLHQHHYCSRGIHHRDSSWAYIGLLRIGIRHLGKPSCTVHPHSQICLWYMYCKVESDQIKEQSKSYIIPWLFFFCIWVFYLVHLPIRLSFVFRFLVVLSIFHISLFNSDYDSNLVVDTIIYYSHSFLIWMVHFHKIINPCGYISH